MVATVTILTVCLWAFAIDVALFIIGWEVVTWLV